MCWLITVLVFANVFQQQDWYYKIILHQIEQGLWQKIPVAFEFSSLQQTTKHTVMKIKKVLPLMLMMGMAIYYSPCAAQEKKVAQTPQELYNEIASMDSIIFSYFNTQQLDKFKALFTSDLEWFQDNDGLIPRKKVFENFKATFSKPWKLTRQLVPGSLEVHPLKGYGAIEIGRHEFRHTENGKEELGTFKFLMIWRKKDGLWKIARVVSYDH
jgi:Domain of unknown function (DUF4440)